MSNSPVSNSLVAFSNELADAVERAGLSVITVLEGGRDGVSGTVWREGIAVTSEHTIRGLDEVTVLLPSSRNESARRGPRSWNRYRDTAGSRRLRIRCHESRSRVGKIVLAVGRREAEGLAVTSGIIGAISGPWRTWQGHGWIAGCGWI